jgi:hypothetical protein
VGFPTIQAEVSQGGPCEAQLYAASANRTYGLRRTNLNKHRAVRILLEDEAWQQWSDREIARHGVTHPLVWKLRQELSGHGYQIPETRQVQRGETVYAMETTKIGAGQITQPPLMSGLQTTFRLP